MEVKRGIDTKEAVEYVKSKVNNEFLEDLPITIEDLAKYARRRVDPFIAPTISPKLKEKMLAYRQTDGEYLLTFAKIIRDVFNGKTPAAEKKAFILLSQTGAGKSLLRQKILSENKNTVRIDSDYYKSFRSDAEEIRRDEPSFFGALTAIDSYDQRDNITDFAIDHGYNILSECAPNKKQGFVGIDFDKLANNGYDTSIEVLIVGDLVSALAIHQRYERDLMSPDEKIRKSAKLTDLDRHDESYKAVIDCLKDRFEDDGYRNVRVYLRGENNTFPRELEFTPSEEIEDVIDLIVHERRSSDFIYSFTEGKGSFLSDFDEIAESMLKRNAPKVEIEQLDRVYNYYMRFRNKYGQLAGYKLVPDDSRAKETDSMKKSSLTNFAKLIGKIADLRRTNTEVEF